MNRGLVSLHIRDFAIIAELDIEFEAGFTVLSGETGAGKSILFDALSLVLGERADSNVIRHGASRTDISARFGLQGLDAIRGWLSERELLDPDEPDTLLLRRLIPQDGASRAFINGSPCRLGDLKALGEQLVDIHGQHAHQSLLKGGEQRRLLDAFAGHDAHLRDMAAAHQALSDLKQRIEAYNQGGQDASQRLDLLRYQLQELDELAPEAGDFEALEAEYRRISAADSLLQQAAAAHELLYGGEPSVYDLLQQAIQNLGDAAEVDPRFTEAQQLCEQAQIQVKEAARLSDDLAAGVEPDPERLQALSRRLDSYQSLARKHRVLPETLGEHWQGLKTELRKLEHADEDLASLQNQLIEAEKRYRDLSARLSASRATAAETLAAAITKTMQPLGLPHARCHIQINHRPEAAPQASGQDQVEFQVAMNPGQPAAPLAKVASGGELARTSLAIQVVCLNQSPVPILLFDEVDVGIGGAVAEVVGRRLKELSQHYQVFCVTHQPQVASLASRHFAVGKQVREGQTYTQLTELRQSSRIEELARMLGGMRITEQTRSHAREMLELGQGA